MTLVWRPGFQFDADASTYIEAVEAADTQALETGVRYAINDFVIGCKNDGIWDAIKASCILAGARTLNGALVPLKGTAPTNFNFVSGDYNRETGLVGDRSTKYLDTAYVSPSSLQNNIHFSVSITSQQEPGFACEFLGSSTSIAHLTRANNGTDYLARVNSSAFGAVTSAALGLFGVSRQDSANFLFRVGGSTQTIAASSSAPSASTFKIYQADIGSRRSNARLAFYSIGESLDLAALDTRVSNLITAIGAAIP